MADYIERQAAVSRFSFENGDRIPEKDVDGLSNTISLRDVKSVLRSVPTANVRENVQGAWVTSYRSGVEVKNSNY